LWFPHGFQGRGGAFRFPRVQFCMVGAAPSDLKR
jgi:hypothetical protein